MLHLNITRFPINEYKSRFYEQELNEGTDVNIYVKPDSDNGDNSFSNDE